MVVRSPVSVTSYSRARPWPRPSMSSAWRASASATRARSTSVNDASRAWRLRKYASGVFADGICRSPREPRRRFTGSPIHSGRSLTTATIAPVVPSVAASTWEIGTQPGPPDGSGTDSDDDAYADSCRAGSHSMSGSSQMTRPVLRWTPSQVTWSRMTASATGGGTVGRSVPGPGSSPGSYGALTTTDWTPQMEVPDQPVMVTVIDAPVSVTATVPYWPRPPRNPRSYWAPDAADGVASIEAHSMPGNDPHGFAFADHMPRAWTSAATHTIDCDQVRDPPDAGTGVEAKNAPSSVRSVGTASHVST